MDDRSLVDLLRAQGDGPDELGGADVDALVHRAVAQGRQRRTRRRIAGGVLAALVVTGLAVTGPSVLRTLPAEPSVAGSPAPLPAYPPPSASSPASAPSPTPSPSAATGRVSGTPADVQQTLVELLPDGLTVTGARAERTEGGNGFAWEHEATLSVRDAAGVSYVLGGVGAGHYADGCFNLEDCETTTLPDGGTLWITSSPAGDKSGLDRTFSYDRPDGGHVWLMEKNYPSGSAPVTRAGLPLSDRQGRALVTSDAWDALFQG